MLDTNFGLIVFQELYVHWEVPTDAAQSTVFHTALKEYFSVQDSIQFFNFCFDFDATQFSLLVGILDVFRIVGMHHFILIAAATRDS